MIYDLRIKLMIYDYFLFYSSLLTPQFNDSIVNRLIVNINQVFTKQEQAFPVSFLLIP